MAGCGTFHIEGRLELLPAHTEISATPQSTTSPTLQTDENLYPILPDAYNLLSNEGAILYNSRTAIDSAITFYEMGMLERGWIEDGYFELQGSQGVTLAFVDDSGRETTIVIRIRSQSQNQTNPVTQVVIDHEDGFVRVRLDD